MIATGHTRVPPQDTETEKALLGALMINQGAIYESADIVHIDSFYTPKHRTIFDAMLSLYGKSEPIDVVTVAAKLSERKQLQDVGGRAYLSELAGSAASPGSAAHYAQIVQTKFMLRALGEAAAKIGELGFAEDREIDQVLDEAQQAVFAISNSSTMRNFVSIKDELTEAWERLESLQKHTGALRGIPTGFPGLDSMLSGLQKSDLIILAARPSMGKTALALDIARQSATKHQTPVGVFSLEMSSQQLVDRMLAAQAGVNAWRLRTGKISRDDEYARLQTGIAELSEAPIYIDDKPGNTVLAMRSTARRMKMEKGLGLVIVDYLQLITPSFMGSNISTVQQVTEISRSLKQMARELDVPVLALSQLSREIEKRRGRPKLSDLRDSGCLAGETLIIDAETGVPHTIRELAGGKAHMKVFALDEHFHVAPHAAVRFFASGRKQVFCLATRTGRTVRASANHLFKTLGGWKRLDELKEGDFIAVPRALSPAVSKNALSDNELVFLAHLLGDGCILPKQPYHYTTASPMNQSHVIRAAKELFNIDAKVVRQENWVHVYFTSPYRLTRGVYHPITNWFKKLGMERVRSYEKRMPDSVFACSQGGIALFLKHLWSTDGNISVKRMPGRSEGVSIYYASSSKKLTSQTSHLLLRLGIRSSIRRVPSAKGYRDMYHLYVESAPDQLAFLEIVGIADERTAHIPAHVARLRTIVHNTNNDVIPREAWRLVVAPAKDERDMSWRDVAQSMGIAYNGSALMKNGIGRTRLTTIGSLLESQTCLELATSDVLWDKIVSIEAGTIEDVYDATVPGVHNFVANDIVVHNSLEQDADVVMFIHREDMMDSRSEGEKNNIAEILIEKHRNGPIGKIDLLFDNEKTTFLTIEKSDFGDFTTEAKVGGDESTPF